MVTVVMSLRKLIRFGHARTFGKVLPLDDARLRKELPRAFLRYLGVKGGKPAVGSGKEARFGP